MALNYPLLAANGSLNFLAALNAMAVTDPNLYTDVELLPMNVSELIRDIPCPEEPTAEVDLNSYTESVGKWLNELGIPHLCFVYPEDFEFDMSRHLPLTTTVIHACRPRLAPGATFTLTKLEFTVVAYLGEGETPEDVRCLIAVHSPCVTG